MATAEEGCFPSVDEVLNELKSNGTFDQFRKTCLASVEAEVRVFRIIFATAKLNRIIFA